MKLLEELGKVKSIMFGYEDHGILTLFLHLDFGGSGQGFGGMILSRSEVLPDHRYKQRGTLAGTDLVCRLLDLFGVQDLYQIKNRYIIALRETPSGDIIGLRLPRVDGDREFLLRPWQEEMNKLIPAP